MHLGCDLRAASYQFRVLNHPVHNLHVFDRERLNQLVADHAPLDAGASAINIVQQMVAKLPIESAGLAGVSLEVPREPRLRATWDPSALPSRRGRILPEDRLPEGQQCLLKAWSYDAEACRAALREAQPQRASFGFGSVMVLFNQSRQ